MTDGTSKKTTTTMILLRSTGRRSRRGRVHVRPDRERARHRRGRVTLRGVSATTLFFSDRPERLTGHVPTEEFLASWGVGDDNFAENPPNALLSIFEEDTVNDVVVVLREPVLSGGDMSYAVEVTDGELTPSTGPCEPVHRHDRPAAQPRIGRRRAPARPSPWWTAVAPANVKAMGSMDDPDPAAAARHRHRRRRGRPTPHGSSAY